MDTQDTHLLQNFSDTEKIAYLSAIAAMAGSDGTVTPEESAFITALCDRADLSEAAEQQVMYAAQNSTPQTLQQNLDTLKSSQLRFSLITDLISFAYSDNAFTADEEEKIKMIATYLNINDQQFTALHQFVQAANKTQITEEDVAQPQNFASKAGVGDMLNKAGIDSNMLMKGALGILAPLVLSRMMRGGGNFRRGGMMGGMGGGLGGILGGLLGGMGGGGMMGGYGRNGGMTGGGGLGSLVSILGGLGGRGGYSQRGGAGGMGGLGGLLGGLMGGGKTGW